MRNDLRIKKYVGKIIGKICNSLYEVIQKEAYRLNIYTYEIRYPSRAFKIFMSKEYDFEKEDILRRELLIYFVNSDNDGDQSRFMRSITPLNFDSGSEADYIQTFDSKIEATVVIEELESLYEDEIQNVKERKAALAAIGSNHLLYDPNDDDNED